MPYLILALIVIASTLPICLPKQHYYTASKISLWTLVATFIIAIGCWTGSVDQHTLPLLSFNALTFTLSFQFDALACVMLCNALLVGLVIYAYASCYMYSDVTRSRFLFQIGMVLASVTILILANNLFTAFVGWQLIGFSLYLLLNHYHYDLYANRAAKKKFVINRIGDLCFLVAVVIASRGDTHTFASLATHPNSILIATLVFIAIMTKSAQFPFHIWLPDTMETPTPVSALMHAGVINSGGFLLARLGSTIGQSHILMTTIAIIGLITAITGSFFMLMQPDTKKKLAYSTMGQMGYMVLQCGLGAFHAAIFHLITHGFFKASLFLNAGNTLKRKPTKPCKQSWLTIIVSLALATLFTITAINLSASLQLHFPILIWGFIGFTLLQLIHNTVRQDLGTLTTFALFVGIAATLAIYLFIIQAFDQHVLIEGIYHAWSNTTQITLITLLLVGQLVWWSIDKSHIKQHRLWHSMMHISIRKGFIEESYRKCLLHPLRYLGEMSNQYCYRSSRRAMLPVLAILIIITLGIMHTLQLFTLHTLDVMRAICTAVLIITAIVANRSNSPRRIFTWLLLLQLGFIGIGLFGHNLSIHTIAYYHLINLAPIVLVLAYLMCLHGRGGEMQTHISKNKLSWHNLYLSAGLLLLIGIPGTASFISEIYILQDLMASSPIQAGAYIVGMLMLAIVVMHALQVYVFNHHTSHSNQALPMVVHLVFWFTLACNVFNGIHPSWLLNTLSAIRTAAS